MELINKETSIDFIGQRRLAMIVSAVLLVIAIAAIVVRGLNLGLDFTGGTLVEMGYGEPVQLEQVRQTLTENDFNDAIVQTFGSDADIVVRTGPASEGRSEVDFSTDLVNVLKGVGPGAEMRRVEFVGPKIGDELAEKGGMAMLYALAGILLYIIIRFQWKFSVGAVAALVHDVVITLGMFALFQFDFDLTVLAAILAVIGYSLNDTIVVYDRIRENFHEMRKAGAIQIFNRSINQMLSRTLMTSFTTLVVLICLFVFGGEIIRGFAIALIIGVVIGTYSSIYVAGSALVALDVSKADLMPAAKEGDDLSMIP